MPVRAPKTLFVTGASAGLGLAMARKALSEGCEVWGTARERERLAVLAGEPRFHAVELDLHDLAGAVIAFEAAEARAGGFDVIINNAGYGAFGEFTAVEAEVWRAQLDAMLVHTVILVHRQLRGLRERRDGGVLVNVASMAVEFPLPFMSAYNIAKAGLSALSESLLVETRGTMVSVIDFRPGDFRTGFNRAMQRPDSASLPSSTSQSDLDAAWTALEANLAVAPVPERAATDLWRAVTQDRRGVVRSGGWFQTAPAPLLKRLVPLAWARAITWRYFGLR